MGPEYGYIPPPASVQAGKPPVSGTLPLVLAIVAVSCNSLAYCASFIWEVPAIAFAPGAALGLCAVISGRGRWKAASGQAGNGGTVALAGLIVGAVSMVNSVLLALIVNAMPMRDMFQLPPVHEEEPAPATESRWYT